MNEKTQKLYLNGNIFTGDRNDSRQEAIVTEGDKIAFVGSNEDARKFVKDETNAVDLQGAFVMPGLIDSHCHAFSMGAIQVLHVQLMEAQSYDEIIETIRIYVAENPDKDIYHGFGWYNGFFENGMPTADILDDIIPDKPAAMRSVDGHSLWVNSNLLEFAGITSETPDPEGGHIEHYPDGRPNGCFRDQAQNLIFEAISDFTKEEYMDSIIFSQNLYASLGYTSYYEATMNDSGTKGAVDAYYELDKKGLLKETVRSSFLVDPLAGDVMAELDKAMQWHDKTKGGRFEVTDVKIYIDGVVEGRTAYLLEGYSDEPDYKGVTRWDTDELKEQLVQVIARANEYGMSCHFHVIGDGAVKDALDAIEKAQKITGRNDCRNIITHLQVVRPEDIRRAAELNVITALNPWGYKQPGYYNEIEVPYLGDRAAKEYPYRKFLDAGTILTAATDFPAGQDVDPLANMQIYATRQKNGNPETLLGPEEALDMKTVIDMFTGNAAYLCKSEKETGKLKAGMNADFIVLDNDITAIDPNEREKTNRLLTVANGEVLFNIKDYIGGELNE